MEKMIDMSEQDTNLIHFIPYKDNIIQRVQQV